MPDRCTEFGHHRLAGIGSLLDEDILRYATFAPHYRPKLSFTAKLSIFLKPSLLSIGIHRLSHWHYVHRRFRLARALAGLNLLVFKANIPPQSCIGPGFFLGHSAGTTFHGSAGRHLTLFSLAICCPEENRFAGPVDAGPVLGDNVTLGGHAVVIGSIRVGDDVKVGPLTRVGDDWPGNSLAVSSRLRPALKPARPDYQA